MTVLRGGALWPPATAPLVVAADPTTVQRGRIGTDGTFAVTGTTRVGERLRFFVLAVQDDPRRPGIILSRAHPKFVVKLFELEIHWNCY